MTNNKPYIEYNNKKYEFNANWKLKKEFNKSIQNAYANIRLSLTDEELDVFEEVKKFTEEHPTLKENDLMALPKEMKEKYIKLLNTMQSIDLSSIYEEYCFFSFFSTTCVKTFSHTFCNKISTYSKPYSSLKLFKISSNSAFAI